MYGIEINSINYHIKKIFADAELDDKAVIRKIRITGSDGKSYNVNHYNLQVIIALGFKIDQLVYKLYGLTDEEIAVVEGRGESNVKSEESRTVRASVNRRNATVPETSQEEEALE